MSTTMGDVFRRAAEIIRERGQARGVGEDRFGRVCLAHAANLACIEAGHPCSWLAILDAFNVYRNENHLRALGPVEWNDKTATRAEVEKFFLFAADRADFPDGQS